MSEKEKKYEKLKRDILKKVENGQIVSFSEARDVVLDFWESQMGSQDNLLELYEEILKDKKIILAIVSRDGNELMWLSEDLKTKEICLSAISNIDDLETATLCLRHVPEHLREEIASEAISREDS